MKNSTKLIVAGASLCMLYTAPVFAQGGDNLTLEEIIITGRKREESLQEVPVSISVLGENLIQDAGIVDQYDLFEMVPGIHYDEVFDRNAAQASIRGVQSNEVATNRTKVTAFIDGMPILGSQGSIGFGNVQQVEIYRGPQSAAFGRSTFGGAINYVTRDPSDTFEGQVNVNVSDYGQRIFGASIGGPLTDTLGYQLEAQIEDSTAPSDYVSSDGIRYGERTGQNLSGKLVWSPTDAFTAELAYSTVSTDDTPTVDYFITEAARDACAGTLGVDSVITMGMGGGVYNLGTADCNWDQGSQFLAQNDRALFLEQDLDAGALAGLVAAAQLAGAPGTTAEVEADILTVASAYSIPKDDVGGTDDRDRVTLQLDYLMDNGHALQLSAMNSEETYIRHYDGSGNYTDALGVTYDGGTGFYSADTGTLMTIMSDPSLIEEDYVEVRWVSPAEDRLRYVVGGSVYKYHFETLKYFDNGYGAILGGFVPEFEALTGINQLQDVSAIVEDATNSGVFFNVAYDITDKLTATLEGRYQNDDVSGVDPNSGSSGGIESKGFIPRLSFNYNINENQSYYVQFAKGVNPGGVNTDYFNSNAGGFADTLDNGLPDGLGYSFAAGNYVATTNAACDGSAAAIANAACNSSYVDYNTDTFSTFKEEELTNIEFGFKGTALDGRFQYAGAVYRMAWKDQVNAVNLSWDHPDAAGGMDMAGDPVPGGGTLSAVFVQENNFADSRTFANTGDLKMQGLEFEGTYLMNENWSVRGAASYLDGEFDDGYCDVGSFGNGLQAVADGVVVLTPDADGVLSACNLVEGKTLNRQPALTFAVSPSYSTDLDSGMRLNARTDIRWESDQYRDVLNVGETPAVTTVNASVGLSNDNWSATLYINNLLDDDTPRQFGAGNDSTITSAGPFGASNYSVQPRIPRAIGLRASYNF